MDVVNAEDATQATRVRRQTHILFLKGKLLEGMCVSYLVEKISCTIQISSIHGPYMSLSMHTKSDELFYTHIYMRNLSYYVNWYAMHI